MNAERDIEIASVRVVPAWPGADQVQACDRLAGTGAAIGVDHRNRIDEPVITITIGAGGVGRHLYVLRLRLGMHALVAAHI